VVRTKSRGGVKPIYQKGSYLWNLTMKKAATKKPKRSAPAKKKKKKGK